MKVAKALSIGDLRRSARRRLPRIAFQYLDGGVEDETGSQRNLDDFAAQRLVPRYLVDIEARDQSAVLFGRRYQTPFGIAPTGMAALMWREADLLLAAAAAKADMPFILSGNGTASIETVMAVAPQHGWLQLYVARDAALSDALIGRARDAGAGALVVTVDVPVHGKREYNLRNGFVKPYRPSRGALFEALRHPAWCLDYLRRGLPPFEGWAPYAPGRRPLEIADFVGKQVPGRQTWQEIEHFRRLWPGKLLLKGILHPADARRAAEAGCDGVIVSNHGGRQLDRAPSALAMLPRIKAAVGGRMAVLFDSGVRRGADIVIARCLGADYVFTGRATLYGAAAAGGAGIARAIQILKQEIDLTLAQIGCPRFADLGEHCLEGATSCADEGSAA